MATAGKVTAGAIAAIGTSATALSVAFVNGVKDTANLGDEIDKASQKMGIATDTYQELAYAAELSGTNMGTLQRASKELLESGSDLPLTDALLECADAIDPVAKASEMFGERVAMELTPMLNTGADGIRGMMQEARDYGMVMSNDAVKASAKFNDSITKMKGTVTGLKNTMMSQFLPSMTSITDGIAMIFNGDEGGIQVMEDGIEEMLDKITDNLPKFLEMGSEIIFNLANGVIEKLPQIAESVIKIVTTIVNKLTESLPQILEVAGELFMQIVNALPDVVKALVNALPSVIDSIVNFFTENFDAILDAAIDIFLALVEALPTIITKLVEALPKIITTIVDALLDPENFQKVLNGAIQLMMALITAIPQIAIELVKALPQIITSIVSFFTNPDNWKAIIDAVFELGKSIITGIWDGFCSLIDTVRSDFLDVMDWLFGEDDVTEYTYKDEQKAKQMRTDMFARAGIDVSNVPDTYWIEPFTAHSNVFTVNLDVDKRNFGQVSFDAVNGQQFKKGG